MVSVLVAIFFVAVFDTLQGQQYTTKWDDMNVDQILSSERLLKNYKKCLMDQGSCTPDGSELKKTLPDALKTDCQRCTPKQREKTKKVIDFMMEKKPDWWAELEEKYDPSGIYRKRKVAYLKKKSEKEKSSNINS